HGADGKREFGAFHADLRSCAAPAARCSPPRHPQSQLPVQLQEVTKSQINIMKATKMEIARAVDRSRRDSHQQAGGVAIFVHEILNGLALRVAVLVLNRAALPLQLLLLEPALRVAVLV
ncbi:unnamed protein product, partial [Prorocentrum cordatum]